MASAKDLRKEGIVIRIPAVISQGTESHVKPGRLTILVSGLEIHDSNSLLLHRFKREDVDDIKIRTHYEVSICQWFIGKPDIAFHLISAKMPEVIPILEMQFSKKIEFLEDALMLRSTGTSSPAEKGYSVWQAVSKPVDCTRHQEPSSGSQEGKLLQVQMREPLISEEDTQELRQILGKLKGLALDAQAELERQDEALDGIATAVDRATLTIDKHNRRVKKLT